MEIINQVLQDNSEKEQKSISTLQSTNNLQQENTNCLALTVRKEYKITVVKNMLHKGIKVSWKIALSIFVMNFLNSFL